MSSFPCVHHVEIGVTDGPRVVNILRNNYTFDIVATRNSRAAHQWLLKKHNTRYLVTCLKSTLKEQIQNDDYIIDWMDSPNTSRLDNSKERHRKDSVFNVCLQVDNMEKTLERLNACGVEPFRNVKTISDSFGSVRMCTIKSCVGDVYHTLLEKDNYNCTFLPGFKQITNNCACDSTLEEYWSEEEEQEAVANDLCNVYNGNSCDNKNVNISSNTHLNHGHKTRHKSDNTLETTHSDIAYSTSPQESNSEEDPTWTLFDHVALAVEMGTSRDVISWYENCFGMKRFLINNEEDNDEGLVLSTDDVGLRLRAMEYWKCAETGLAGPKVDDPTGGNRLSMVIVEGLPPLPGTNEVNQVESWLSQHGGPGIQHIALSTGDIKATVGSLKRVGATFANAPPAAYYSEMGRLSDIHKAGEDVDVLREHGILIDTEANRIDDDNEQARDCVECYLLQIFTRPILPKDPFFMELIQREGATGFGSGNVAALYRSVQASIVNKAKDIDL